GGARARRRDGGGDGPTGVAGRAAARGGDGDQRDGEDGRGTHGVPPTESRTLYTARAAEGSLRPAADCGEDAGMTDQPSVVVVGAGAIGLCTAFELHELGVRDVTVREKRHVVSASSGLAVGIIETQYLDPVPIAIRVYAMD